MTVSDLYPPRRLLTDEQRVALQAHHLMQCALEEGKPARYTWRCSCREKGGALQEKNAAHYAFARHLEEVKVSAHPSPTGADGEPAAHPAR